jgi:hypothetical protein
MKPAALAHLGERQTEVHFESPYHLIRFLEVLCSIHRSGISSRFLLLLFCPGSIPSRWQFNGMQVFFLELGNSRECVDFETVWNSFSDMALCCCKADC